MPHPPLDFLLRAIETDDLAAVAGLVEQFRSKLDLAAPENACIVARVLGAVRSSRMTDLFLRNGLTLDRVSEWWRSGFGLQRVPLAVAQHLLHLGAVITPHAAAALGLVDELRALLDRDPTRIHAKGGDGGRPLHFSRDVATAQVLIERGAELDPRDDDHDSTPAQWRIGDAPEVTRYLLKQGAKPDLFMAAGLGDLELARILVDRDPASLTYRIGNNSGPFPGVGFQGRGGTIYQWTLGFNRSPQEIAWERGYRELFDYLMSCTPPRARLLVFCMQADRVQAEKLVAERPGLMHELNAEDHALLAKCCWETNLNREAVRLMLDLGFPVAAPEFNHGFQPLHNAAWCGDADLVELLLQRGHPVDERDPGYHSTALGFAIHSCVTAQRHPEGDFPRVVRRLLEAGTPLDKKRYPTGQAGIDAVIRAWKER